MATPLTATRRLRFIVSVTVRPHLFEDNDHGRTLSPAKVVADEIRSNLGSLSYVTAFAVRPVTNRRKS
jgi:hypothetical protein